MSTLVRHPHPYPHSHHHHAQQHAPQYPGVQDQGLSYQSDLYHHRPRHLARQQSVQPAYTATVPEDAYEEEFVGSSQPNLFKQINIIPGLDAENAIVDTGIKLVRPSGGSVQASTNSLPGNEFDGKRMRRSIQRRTVDYNASTIQLTKHRLYRRSILQRPTVQPDPLYYIDMIQPQCLLHNPINSVTTRFVRASTNKVRCPVFSVAWTPEGRRVVTGTSSGEFTLWNGLTFNFETILQAHESSVRAMEWSHNDMWLLSGDHNGVIKYWQSNMNQVKMIQAHDDPVRGLGFCPTDNKFATCSDDGLIKIWDFYRCVEENVLRGHGADVKCLGWHPTKCMVASGSKDSQQPLKLWDPKSGMSLATIHSHKSTVMDLHWNKNGNWLLTGSRDRLIKVFDIRMMKEIFTFRGHKKEAASVNWHPLYEEMFCSGGSDGTIMFWLMGCEKELGVMENAHDGMIWDLKWHPLGHILCSGANDHTTKFWTRNRPGDKMRDRYNLNILPAGYEDDYEYELPTATQPELDLSVNDTSLNTSLLEEPTAKRARKDSSQVSQMIQISLQQASLEVPRVEKSEEPQVHVAQPRSFLRASAPSFKIDISMQREALQPLLDEERRKRSEEQMFREIDVNRKKALLGDTDVADDGAAPSLLSMEIEVPEYLRNQKEWDNPDYLPARAASERSAGKGFQEDEPGPRGSGIPSQRFDGPAADLSVSNGPPGERAFHSGSDRFEGRSRPPPGSRTESSAAAGPPRLNGPPSLHGSASAGGGPPYDGLRDQRGFEHAPGKPSLLGPAPPGGQDQYAAPNRRDIPVRIDDMSVSDLERNPEILSWRHRHANIDT